MAYRLRDEGWHLLTKTYGNNYQGYALGVLVHDDGTIVDILIDEGNKNTPTWSVDEGGDGSGRQGPDQAP